MKQTDWFKVKSYTHLTPKIPVKQKNWITEYVKDESKIRSHRFYPMIHYTIVENRYQRQKVNGTRDKLRTPKAKARQIYYSNHIDGHIFSYYASQLSDLLNKLYEADQDLMDSVIAYRSIPFNKKRNKCNIDYANEVFKYIRNSSEKKLSAICLDVSSYFDTVNHKILKKQWANLLNRVDLPLDHFKVFKAITKFAFIEISDVFNLTPHAKINKLSHLRFKNLESFFVNGKEFRNLVQDTNSIRVNRQEFGIPQGSPISAVLSNLYLLDFDRLMVKLAKLYNGLYRRYSDDIVFICDPKWIDIVNHTVKDFLVNNLNLNIQDKKTQRVDFERTQIGHDWGTTLNEEGIKYKGMPLTYLGFDFDGKVIRIKQKSISSFYRKLKRNIRRAAYFARKTKEAQSKGFSMNKDPWIYRTKIYRLKTHLGARKKSIDGRVFWGNYLSYVYNSSKIMCEPAIKKQLRNHWKIVENEINRFNEKYDLIKSTPDKKLHHDHAS